MRCYAGPVIAEWSYGRGEDRASTEKTRVCKTLNKISELQTLLGGLSGTYDGEPVRVAELVAAGMLQIRSVIVATLSKSNSRVSQAI